MGHRRTSAFWTSALTNPIRLGTRVLARAIRSRILDRIQNLGRIGMNEAEGQGRSTGIVQMPQMNQPGNWVRGLIDFKGSGSEKTHGSLMNRLAILLKVFTNTIAAALGVAVVFGSLSVPVLAADSAKKLYDMGQSAEAREDYDAAYEAYRKAYAKSPNDLRMRTAYYRLRQAASSTHVSLGRKLEDKGDQNGALTQFLR